VTELEQKAFGYIGSYRLDSLVDAKAPQVGDLVVIHSRGAYRLAVVEKRGTKRVEVVYTTNGSVTEAQRISAMYQQRLASQAWKADGAAAGRNWDYYLGESNPATRKYSHNPEAMEQIAATVALGRDAYVAKVEAESEAKTRAAAADHWTSWLNFTRKSVPFAKVYEPAAGLPAAPINWGPLPAAEVA
jgi:hypothetical protein